MTLSDVKKRLEASGMTVKEGNVYNAYALPRPCLIISHDYEGLYRTAEAANIAHNARRIAERAGYSADDRNISTVIYKKEA